MMLKNVQPIIILLMELIAGKGIVFSYGSQIIIHQIFFLANVSRSKFDIGPLQVAILIPLSTI